MIIDAHTHIGKKTLVATAEDLIKSMDNAGIDKSLVFAGKINEQATDVLLQDIAPYKGRLYGIGSVSLATMQSEARKYYDTNPYEFIDCPTDKKDSVCNYLNECFKNNQIYGLKFYLGYEHFYCNDTLLRPYLDLLVKYNKPAIFHTGDLYNGVKGAKLKYAHPLTIDDLAVDMPKLKIIIAHIGYPFVREAAEVCYKNENCYTDMSGFVYGTFGGKDINNYIKVLEEFIRITGDTKKLIFGTDWPISEQKSYIETNKALLRNLDTASLEVDQIMGLRASNLFGIG